VEAGVGRDEDAKRETVADEEEAKRRVEAVGAEPSLEVSDSLTSALGL
jgi:hypothetical protein